MLKYKSPDCINELSTIEIQKNRLLELEKMRLSFAQIDQDGAPAVKFRSLDTLDDK